MSKSFDELRTRMGYKTEKEMFESMYHGTSIQNLSKQLGISQWLLRKKLVENGIALHAKGGARRKPSFQMTSILIERLKTEGVDAIAKEFNVSKFTIFKKRKAFLTPKPAPQPSSSVQSETGVEEDPASNQ
jgi:hypothetical protein